MCAWELSWKQREMVRWTNYPGLVSGPVSLFGTGRRRPFAGADGDSGGVRQGLWLFPGAGPHDHWYGWPADTDLFGGQRSQTGSPDPRHSIVGSQPTGACHAAVGLELETIGCRM